MNKSKVLHYFTLILIFIAYSCKFKNAEQIKQTPDKLFSKKITIEGAFIFKDTGLSLGDPTAILTYDSLIILMNPRDKYLLHIIDINSGIILAKYGVRGNGPGEFLTPFGIAKLNDHQIGVFDVNKKKYYKLEIDSILNSVNYITKNIIDLSGTKQYNTYILPIKKDLSIGIGIFNGGKYALYKKNKLITKKFNHPLDEFPNEADKMKAMAYQGMLTQNYSTIPRFAFTAYYSGILEICELVSENDMKKIIDIHSYYPKYRPDRGSTGMGAAMSRDNIVGYVNAFGTKNFIYALYSGRTYNEYGASAFDGNIILVFDWDGMPIVMIELDHDLEAFCIDNNENHLYGITQVPEAKIIRYNLNEVRTHIIQ